MTDVAPRQTPGLEQMKSYYENYPEVLKSYEGLVKHAPDVLDGYLTLRRAAFADDSEHALPLKVKELIVIAVECALRKTNPPPLGHARRAIDAGATLQEIVEAVAICIPITGMMSYQESGQFVLKEAERYLAERSATAEEHS